MDWENRWHPLLEQWVTITSHRGARPWKGSVANVANAANKDPVIAASYDPDCYLCPGNTRISGEINPDYEEIFVFDNDHPSFDIQAPEPRPSALFYKSSIASGVCRVMCYDRHHQTALGQLPVQQIEAIVASWIQQSRLLYQDKQIKTVFIFENRGELVGVSNPHPHCQIYGVPFVMDTIGRELAAVQRYRQQHNVNLFSQILRAEQEDGRRILFCDDHWLGFVPYFARLPYEMYLMSRSDFSDLRHCPSVAVESMARGLKIMLAALDALWNTPQPYILTVHQAPVADSDTSDYRCFIQIIPLMRAPGLQKFLAGVETGAGQFLNDGSPEQKAMELRQAQDRGSGDV
jgi:UDPglucose--hexose-1-phosphate uridylyltransferase